MTQSIDKLLEIVPTKVLRKVACLANVAKEVTAFAVFGDQVMDLRSLDDVVISECD